MKPPYIKKPEMTIKELVAGWKAKQEGSTKWIDCMYCKHQIVGASEADLMPEMGQHRISCRDKRGRSYYV